MLENNYHYRLNLPILFSPVYLEPSSTQHNIYDLELLTEEFKNWLSNLGIMIIFGEQFLLDPNKRKTYYPHIDDPTVNDHVKLNYVYCDTLHSMNWYKLKLGKEIVLAKTSVGTSYGWANREDCELVHSATVGTPSLVNASIIHDVTPVTTIRYCFSFTLGHLNNPSNRITWKQATSIFKDYFV